MAGDVAQPHFLGIGDMVFAEAPASVVTILGSCVAITMYDPLQRLGAICHAALPTCSNRSLLCGDCKPGKHVECAVQVMLKQFRRCGVSFSELQVKIFGGAEMFTGRENNSSYPAIGKVNGIAAERVVKKAGLTLHSQDTGGYCKRKIIFNIGTGKVRVEKGPSRMAVSP